MSFLKNLNFHKEANLIFFYFSGLCDHVICWLGDLFLATNKCSQTAQTFARQTVFSRFAKVFLLLTHFQRITQRRR